MANSNDGWPEAPTVPHSLSLVSPERSSKASIGGMSKDTWGGGSSKVLCVVVPGPPCTALLSLPTVPLGWSVFGIWVCSSLHWPESDEDSSLLRFGLGGTPTWCMSEGLRVDALLRMTARSTMALQTSAASSTNVVTKSACPDSIAIRRPEYTVAALRTDDTTRHRARAWGGGMRFSVGGAVWGAGGRADWQAVRTVRFCVGVCLVVLLRWRVCRCVARRRANAASSGLSWGGASVPVAGAVGLAVSVCWIVGVGDTGDGCGWVDVVGRGGRRTRPPAPRMGPEEDREAQWDTERSREVSRDWGTRDLEVVRVCVYVPPPLVGWRSVSMSGTIGRAAPSVHVWSMRAMCAYVCVGVVLCVGDVIDEIAPKGCGRSGSMVMRDCIVLSMWGMMGCGMEL